jgi:hypothetical protein
MELNDQLHAPVTSQPGKQLQPLNGGQGGAQSGSGRFGVTEKLIPLQRKVIFILGQTTKTQRVSRGTALLVL